MDIASTTLKAKLCRFCRHWVGFALYVYACANIVMSLEKGPQDAYRASLEAQWYAALNRSCPAFLLHENCDGSIRFFFLNFTPAHFCTLLRRARAILLMIGIGPTFTSESKHVRAN